MDAKVIMEKCPPRERLVLPEGCSRPYFYIFILGSLIMGRVLAIDRSLKVCYNRTLANLEGGSYYPRKRKAENGKMEFSQPE